MACGHSAARAVTSSGRMRGGSVMVVRATDHTDTDWNVNRVGVTAGRNRHFSSLLNWRRAGPCFVRAPRRAFSGEAA